MSYFEKTSTVVYSGAWRDGLREGYGKMLYASGNSYEGEWLMDKKHGKGAMKWRKGEDVYIGDWESDNQHGFGEFIWGDEGGATGSSSSSRQTNNIYRGQWKNGLREGRGSFFYGDGSQYNGSWEANLKHGLGVMIYADGKVVAGTFHLDKITTFARHNDVDGKPVPKMADDANLQFRLLVDDVLMKMSVLGGPPAAAGTDAASASSASALKQTQDLERLILRFTSYLKVIFKRLSDAANHRRSASNINDVDATDPYVGSWSTVERTQALARVLHRRFFCLTMADMLELLQNLDVVGSHFSSADLFECLREMRSQHKFMVKATVGKFLQFADSGNPTDSFWCDLVDGFLGPKDLQPNHGVDMRQPLREREFVELLVRCVARADLNKRVYLASTNQPFKQLSLVATVTSFFTRRIYPSASSMDSNLTPYATPVTCAINSTIVKGTLHGGEAALRKLFSAASDKIPGQPTATLKSAILILRGLSMLSITSDDVAVLMGRARAAEEPLADADAGAGDADGGGGGGDDAGDAPSAVDVAVTDSVSPPPPPSPLVPAADYASLDKPLDFVDFTVLLCRVLLTDLCFVPPTASDDEVPPNGDAGGSEESKAAEDVANEAIEVEEAVAPGPPALDDVLNARLMTLLEHLYTLNQ